MDETAEVGGDGGGVRGAEDGEDIWARAFPRRLPPALSEDGKLRIKRDNHPTGDIIHKSEATGESVQDPEAK